MKGKTMKGILFGSMMVLGALGGFAQGTIYFDNRVVCSIVTHVYAPLPSNPYIWQIGDGLGGFPPGSLNGWEGYTLIGANGITGQYGGATTFAQLLIAPGFNQAESSLVPASPIATYRTGAAAGFIQGGITVTASNVLPDSNATVEMVAWDNSSGLYGNWTLAQVAWRSGLIAAGESGRWNTVLGGTSTPPNITWAQSFNSYLDIVPEPSALALAALGVGVRIFAGRRR